MVDKLYTVTKPTTAPMWQFIRCPMSRRGEGREGGGEDERSYIEIGVLLVACPSHCLTL